MSLVEGAPRALFVLAFAWNLGMRLFELARSRRHTRELLARGARAVRPDGMGAIVLVHAGWFVGLVVEELFVGPAPLALELRVACGLSFVAAEGARLWCLRTLGPRWNVRVLVLPGEAPVRRGPYRFLRHPNYAAVVVLLVALPLALGLVWTPALVLVPQLLSLRRRIRIEERALREAAAPSRHEAR